MSPGNGAYFFGLNPRMRQSGNAATLCHYVTKTLKRFFFPPSIVHNQVSAVI